MTDLVFVEEKPMEGREHTLMPGTTIGREGCDIVLADPEVSRRHAAIRSGQGGGLAIEDLGSTNGTFVNDQRITGVRELTDGDTVRLGNTVWRLQATDVGGATQIGQVAGAPQVTAAREIPTDIQPPAREPEPALQATTAQPVPAAAQAQAPAAAQPAAAPSAPPGAPRGDVPAPPAETPSAIRRVLPANAASQPPAFAPSAARKVRGSAATRLEATIVCWLIVFGTAIGVAIYFATYP